MLALLMYQSTFRFHMLYFLQVVVLHSNALMTATVLWECRWAILGLCRFQAKYKKAILWFV